MLNEESTEGNELQLEVIPEDENLESPQDNGDIEGEAGEETLDLKIDEPAVDRLTPAEVNAQKQEEVWLSKVLSGKSVVEDAPSWLQKRLNSRLEATNKVPETEEVVRRVLEKEREKSQFNEELKAVGPLTLAKSKEFNALYAEFKPLGDLKALLMTKKFLGYDSKVKEAEQRGIAKGRTSLPHSGRPQVKQSVQSVGGVPMSTVTDDKAWNELMRGH